jgi:hypothetical protein
VTFLINAKHGLWANKDLLRPLKRNFPYLIDESKLPGVHPDNQSYVEKDHIALRAASVNPLTEIDGRPFAKELVLANFPGFDSRELLERMIALSLYAEENLR